MVLDSQGYGASVEYSEPSTEYGSNPFGSTNESCSNQPGNKTLSSSSNERSDQPGNGNGKDEEEQLKTKFYASYLTQVLKQALLEEARIGGSACILLQYLRRKEKVMAIAITTMEGPKPYLSQCGLKLSKLDGRKLEKQQRDADEDVEEGCQWRCSRGLPTTMQRTTEGNAANVNPEFLTNCQH
ncbi:hypothetical protein GOBAR_AA07549 [Gossypium barbadense]|uniref:Uncharacterized protein n=1 Tax=Gossypium barbadense TaxID=3634 RepID=A0A2P5YBW5_GOSBA|nr:hypothetical protein GOBAR_AA07549 [Gossypium barbadense]